MIDPTLVVRVRRDGPRGWHWISRSKYDPAVHGPDLDAPEPASEPTPVGYAEMDMDDLRKLVEERGLTVTGDARKKADLIATLEAADA